MLTCSSRWLCRLALLRGVFTGSVPKCASERITAVLELIPQHKSLKQYSGVLALLRHLADPNTWHSGLQTALRLATPGLQVGECMALDSWLKRASALLSRSSPPLHSLHPLAEARVSRIINWMKVYAASVRGPARGWGTGLGQGEGQGLRAGRCVRSSALCRPGGKGGREEGRRGGGARG